MERGSTGAPRSAVIVSLTLALTWFDCVHGRPSVTSMSGIMILGVCEHQTRGDKPGRAPPVPPCLGLASGDFGLRSWSAARHRTISRRALRYRIRLSGTHARSAWRKCGGAAVLCAPRTNAASACKGPPCQYSIPRGGHYPNRDSRIFHTYRFAYLSFAYPPHIINSRIYDVGINCHKYVKYVDSRIALL